MLHGKYSTNAFTIIIILLIGSIYMLPYFSLTDIWKGHFYPLIKMSLREVKWVPQVPELGTELFPPPLVHLTHPQKMEWIEYFLLIQAIDQTEASYGVTH